MAAFANKCPKCGTKVKIASRKLDGKKARCPRCSSTFRIKAPPTMKARAAPRPPSEEFSFLNRITDADLADAGPLPEDEFAAEDAGDFGGGETDGELEPTVRTNTPRPSASKKKKRKQTSPQRTDLIVGATVIGVGLLLLAGLGYLGLHFLPHLLGEGAGSRLAWMPDDIEGFLEIEPENLWTARALRPARESKTGVALYEHIEKLLSPIAVADIERIAVGFPPRNSEHPEPVFVLYAKSSFDAAGLRSKAAGFSEASYAGQTYSLGGEPRRAAYFPSSGVLVYGAEEQVKSAIDRGGACAAAVSFPLPSRSTIVFAARRPDRFGTPDLSMIAGHEVGLSAAPDGLAAMTFAVRITDRFDVNGTLTYDSPDKAAVLVSDTERRVEEAIQQLEFQRGELLNTDPTFKLNVGGVKQFFTAQQETLRSFKLRSSGPQVDMQFTLPAYLFEASFELFAGLAEDAFPGALPMEDDFDDADLFDGNLFGN